MPDDHRQTTTQVTAVDDRFGTHTFLVGLATAQLAGQDHLVGLDRVGVDGAGQALVPVAGLGSTTAAGLARRISVEQWAAVETGMATVTARMLARLPAARREALLAWRDD